MRFGSHLYGTDTSDSDLDLKGVYVPEARDILLQRVKPSVTSGREKGAGERNRPGDVDREYYSLQRYLALLAAGQTMAIDMLFAPDTVMVKPPSPVWRDLQAHALRGGSRRAPHVRPHDPGVATQGAIQRSREVPPRTALALRRTE